MAFVILISLISLDLPVPPCNTMLCLVLSLTLLVSSRVHPLVYTLLRLPTDSEHEVWFFRVKDAFRLILTARVRASLRKWRTVCADLAHLRSVSRRFLRVLSFRRSRRALRAFSIWRGLTSHASNAVEMQRRCMVAEARAGEASRRHNEVEEGLREKVTEAEARHTDTLTTVYADHKTQLKAHQDMEESERQRQARLHDDRSADDAARADADIRNAAQAKASLEKDVVRLAAELSDIQRQHVSTKDELAQARVASEDVRARCIQEARDAAATHEREMGATRDEAAQEVRAAKQKGDARFNDAEQTMTQRLDMLEGQHRRANADEASRAAQLLQEAEAQRATHQMDLASAVRAHERALLDTRHEHTSALADKDRDHSHVRLNM